MADQKEQKKVRNLVARDSTGEATAALKEIIEYWNSKQSIMVLNESTVIRALVMSYKNYLRENDPQNLNINKLF